MQEQTQNMIFVPNSSIKMGLCSRTHEKPFSLSKTNFKTMHDMQNKTDHAMQLDIQQEQSKEIKILTSKLGSNGSSHKDQAWKTTLTQELFFLLSRASLSKTRI